MLLAGLLNIGSWRGRRNNIGGISCNFSHAISLDTGRACHVLLCAMALQASSVLRCLVCLARRGGMVLTLRRFGW